jgi:capsular exopolysaccharide synthesis family protein
VQNQNSVSPSPFFAELDLKVYVRIIWHWSWLIVLCTVMAGASAYIVSTFSVPVYQASTTLLINQARNPTTTDLADLTTSERIAQTYAQLMKRDTILTEVSDQLKLDKQVFNQTVTGITVTPVRDTQLLKIDVEGTSPQVIAAVAYTLPLVFIGELKQVQSERFAGSKNNLQNRIQELSNQMEQKQVTVDKLTDSHTPEEAIELGRLRSQLTQLQGTYNSLLQNLETIDLAEVQSSDQIKVVEPPQIPGAPVRPRVLVNTLLAAVVGAMLALGINFLIEYLDDRIKTPQDLYQVLDTPMLGAIARITLKRNKRRRNDPLAALEESLVAALEPRHPITEAYRSLRTNLQFSSIDSEVNSLLVTSASPGEGKTTTVANLAIVMAQSGRSVILIDADMRKPRQHKVFNLLQSPGLTDALILGDTALDHYLRATTVPNLRVLTSGKIPPNPAELLGSQRMKQLIDQLHELADIIIFDAPPLLAVTDAQVLASQVNGVLLVIDSDQTRRATVARAAESLMRANARLLGAVLNRLTRSPRSYYYYNEYNSYYTDSNKANIEETADEVQPQSSQASGVPELKDQRSRNFLDKKLVAEPEPNGVYQLQTEESDL